MRSLSDLPSHVSTHHASLMSAQKKMSLLASKSTVTLPNTPGPLVTVRLIAVPLVRGSETMTASEDWKERKEERRRRRREREK